MLYKGIYKQYIIIELYILITKCLCSKNIENIPNQKSNNLGKNAIMKKGIPDKIQPKNVRWDNVC